MIFFSNIVFFWGFWNKKKGESTRATVSRLEFFFWIFFFVWRERLGGWWLVVVVSVETFGSVGRKKRKKLAWERYQFFFFFFYVFEKILIVRYFFFFFSLSLLVFLFCFCFYLKKSSWTWLGICIIARSHVTTGPFTRLKIWFESSTRVENVRSF